jgi:hypothetical protein
MPKGPAVFHASLKVLRIGAAILNAGKQRSKFSGVETKAVEWGASFTQK